MLLSIDIGTTHTKAGIFNRQGSMLSLAHAPTPIRKQQNRPVIEPEVLWRTVADLAAQAAEQASAGRITAVAITGMAESGLFIDPDDGEMRTPIMPWFDTSSQRFADEMEGCIDPIERFSVTGLHLSYKLGASKWLQVKHADPYTAESSVWLSALSYIAYRLTGRIAEEYTLAARTYAFRIDNLEWDRAFLQELGLRHMNVPEVHSAGTCRGQVKNIRRIPGMDDETEVYVTGHDHLSAALTAGELDPGIAFNSMGTAEVLVGSFPKRPLTRSDYESGLTFGPNIEPDIYHWMGGHSASGGSVEWMRGILGDKATFGYSEMLELLSETNPQPTGIVFFPYLSGRGAPLPDPKAKAAFIGMTAEHGKRELLQSVLEGNAYQMELIREAAEKTAGSSLSRLVACGGGVRNSYWLQIKADVSGIALTVPAIEEAALWGAAMIAAAGSGLYPDLSAAIQNGKQFAMRTIEPDQKRHAAYRELYDGVFRPLLQACT